LKVIESLAVELKGSANWIVHGVFLLVFVGLCSPDKSDNTHIVSIVQANNQNNTKTSCSLNGLTVH